jgi:methylase of polypeptide subunit release factors
VSDNEPGRPEQRDEDTAPLLELCTGAGQIGLAAAALSYRAAVLVDSSEHACRFAARNAAANRCARWAWAHSGWSWR